MSRGLGALAAAWLVACAPPELPGPPLDGAASVLLVAETSPPQGLAVDLTADGAEHFAIGDGTARVWAFLLPRPLDRYAIEPGPLALIGSGPRRAFPRSATVLRLDLTADRQWRAPDDPLPPLGLPPIEAELCAARDGCWSADAGCVIPCAPPTAPAPPTPPRLASMAPCPAGWTPGTFRARQAPTAPPLDHAICEPPACPPGLAGSPCAPIEAACALPADLPATGVFYVRAGATGDGSRAAPSGDLGSALRAGASTIAIDRGTYDWPAGAMLPRGTALLGACARETTIRGTRPLTLAAARIAHLTIEGAALDCASGRCVVEDARVHGPPRALSVTDAELVIARTRITSDAETVVATGSATLTIAAADLTGGVIVASDTASVAIADVTLRGGAAPQARGGIVLGGRVRASVRRAHLELPLPFGLRVMARAHATVSDVFLHGGAVVALNDDAELVADRLRIDGASDFAFVGGAQATITAHDLMVIGRDPPSRGIAFEGRSLTLVRALIDGTSRDGFGLGDGGDVHLEDIVSVGATGEREPDGTFPDGRGLSYRGLGSLTVARALFADNRNEGFAVFPKPGVRGISLTDVRIERSGGSGLILASVYGAQLERVAIAAVAASGLQLGELFDEVSAVGRDVVVDGVVPSAMCRTANCAGNGVLLYGDLDLARFVVRDAVAAGVTLAAGSEQSRFRDGDIGPQAVGIMGQRALFDPVRLLVDVRTSSNTRPLVLSD